MSEEGRGAADRPAGLGSGVELATMCSLELGGAAARLVEAPDVATVRDALRWAGARGLPVAVLAGGTNVVIADTGYPGLVVRMTSRGRTVRRQGGRVGVTVAAGEPWDELVAWSVAEGFAGLECMSGIPGSVGATPVQNVGAYGQEVASCIASVRCLEIATLAEVELDGSECRFEYRGSRFKHERGRYVVLSVTYALEVNGAPTIGYGELGARLGVVARPGLADVREAVLDLRRAKSMLVLRDDPNRRSVGSFFVNPTVERRVADAVRTRTAAGGEMPAHPAADGRVKLSAAWLIERAGFPRGLRRGAVGLSSRHALALVHHGGGTTAELLALALEIRDAVAARFGVELEPEPSFLGFSAPPLPHACLV
jgi:UDP-N-acetylmuramate dehydrogenase